MAEETTKWLKSCSDTVPVDRISELPESLISSILSCLPTKNAVATSILARNWRFRWTKITTLRFNENQVRGDDGVQRADFVDSVNMALLNHCGGSIHKFLLRWQSPNFRPMCLYTWANIAIGRKVRVLSLSQATGNTQAQGELHLPSSLYCSRTLEILKLEGPFRVKPPNVVCLSKLVKMDLLEVIYESDEAFHRLICGCPVLDDLAIVRVDKRDNLVVCSISSPLLKYLYISFKQELKSVDGDMKLDIDAPALEDLTIVDYMSSHISIQRLSNSMNTVVFASSRLAPDMIVGLMHTFTSVKCLKLYSDNMVEMERWPVEVRFKRVTILVIRHFQWSTLMDLLDHCGTLKELLIWCDGNPWSTPAHVPRCLLSSLKYITFKICDGREEEITMLKFFLDNCLQMERVYICLDGNGNIMLGNEAERLKILNTVFTLPRASPACKISCLENSAFLKYIDEL